MKTTVSSRLNILAVFLLAVFAAVELRLIHLQIFRHEELTEMAARYRFTTRVTQSWRGPVHDRHGIPLALTTPVKNVYADLAVWNSRVEPLAHVVAPLLKMDPSSVVQRVNDRLDALEKRDTRPAAGAALLKRGVTPDDWARIKAALESETFGLQTNSLTSRQKTLLKRLRRWTLFAEDDQVRYFPHGTTLASVLGFVGRGTNGHLLQGKWGIETAWDYALAGQNGECVSSQDAAGNELAFSRTKQLQAQDGASLALTIDLTMQKIVEAALATAMTRFHPSNASCIVVRPRTGEILALANLPTFHPQHPGDSAQATWRNHAISDRNEPGSVFKVITLAAALELGAVQLDQQIFCENGHWIYNMTPLRDGGHSYGCLSVRDCLAKSSNIGLAKIAVTIGPERFHYFIEGFGFTQATGLRLPYEVAGFVRHPSDWSGISITRLAIGHELAVSQIELAMAYAALANDGRLMRPLLVSQVDHADGSLWARYQPQRIRSVVRPETARLVREAMQRAVERGTGRAAALQNHTVAGKTGTAQKSDGHRYIPGRLYCSFIGMVPALSPELIIAVAIDEPRGAASGGAVAAPVFREIAEQAVLLYGIPPDKIPETRRRASLPGGRALPPDRLALLF